MNNFTFGNARTSTTRRSPAARARHRDSCPARVVRGFDGTDVVQTHMTNSRLTDPEVLEFRLPGAPRKLRDPRRLGRRGRWHGGNGGTRRVRFLEPMTASILANNRSIAPFGMAGGQPGEAGRNWVERTDGRIEEMGHIGSVEMNPGRRVRDPDAGRRRLRSRIARLVGARRPAPLYFRAPSSRRASTTHASPSS
jgi:5-oxoprolinase (ATP-hydrolysing)